MAKRVKYPVVVTTDNRKDMGSRRDFELQRSEKDAWKPVSWARLKRAAQEETSVRAPTVELLLRGALGNEWIDEGQDFGLDSAGALRAAKMLIQDGLADSVWVNAMYFRPFSRREHSTAHTLFHLEREGRHERNPTSRPNKACGKDQLLVKRKGYKRSDGTSVKGTTFCTEDRGAPGRGKTIIPGIKEGGLGGPGYLKKSAGARHKLLDTCVKKDGYRTCLGRVHWLSVVGKRTFTKEDRANLRGDREYLKRKYGGEGSFGPRKKASNPETARVKARCMR